MLTNSTFFTCIDLSLGFEVRNLEMCSLDTYQFHM